MAVLGRIATGRPPSELPWIAVRDSVVFPEALTELAVGRATSIAAVAAAEASDGWIAVFAQRSPDDDDPVPDALHRVGCAVRVLSTEPMPDGQGVSVRVQPVTRVRSLSWIEATQTGGPRVRVRVLPESNAPLDALTREALETLCVASMRHVHSWSRAEAQRYVRSVATSARLGWLAAAYLALDADALQSLLESDDVHEVAKRVLSCKDELGPGDAPRAWWQRLWEALFG